MTKQPKTYASDIDPVIAAALDERKPAIAEWYAGYVRRIFAATIAAHGNYPGTGTEKGAHDRWVWSRNYREWQAIIDPVTRGIDPNARSFRSPVEIDDALLLAAAKRYAQDVVDSWNAKIAKKVGDLRDVAVLKADVDGIGFYIRGHLGDRKVSITQDIVHNVSKLGTPYAQFPARIYVDGKFTPEKKYLAIRKEAA